jgi:hypothetical protein
MLVPCLLLALTLPASAAERLPDRVEFNRDIRPILSDACFACHGPDARKRKADLRLDTEQGAFATLGKGGKAFVPHNLADSVAWQRISSADARRRMPPATATRPLSQREKALMKRWIEQGAKWQKHWAFLAPRRSSLPSVKDSRWARNPLDTFILARLEREGLRPSPEADRVTLLRRVTIDLTGLAPAPEEVDRFLADTRPGAYERAVDRLLASPRYGERMTIRWLDAARYADTSGYQNDGERIMWRWRDWVIDAFNANMPFDQFTIEQIAGDLLPSPTLDQIIATGFNRNHRGNAEGGIIPEEYAVEYVADRVETTATVWLGLTMGCARCHDHKFDPLTMKDFYRLFAFFNNVPERGKAVKYGNSPPMVLSPTRRQQEKIADLDQRLTTARRRVHELLPRLEKEQQGWEKSFSGDSRSGEPSRTRAVWPGLSPRSPGERTPGASEDSSPGHTRTEVPLGSRHLPSGAGQPVFVPGKFGRAVVLHGGRYLDAGNVGHFGFYNRFSLSAWVYARDQHGGTIVSRMKDEPQGEGYAVVLHNGRVGVHLVKRWLDDAIRVETEDVLAPGRWYHVTVVYDGSRWADGVKVYVDGRPCKLRVHLDELNQTFRTDQPLRIGAGGGPGARFRGAIGDVHVFNRALSAAEAEVLATPESLETIAAIPPARHTSGQARKLRDYYLAGHAPADIRAAHCLLAELEQERQRLMDSVPTTMVMRELPAPRPAHVLIRGQYDRPGEKVRPDVPAVLAGWPAGQKLNRLGLARWLVDAGNPLTARVQINRLWQMLFGEGLVKTAEDFGAQGDWPSHPELLDFLAVEFRESGWDVKHILRLIVTSSTYRQSSRLTPELHRRDPGNRLLARGPRLRLSAEMVRDQALAASGLLVERLGGPSIKPYQPSGLWRELADVEYKRDRGEDLYRRGIYVYWKRTVAPPGLVTFDAGGREACNVRETRTNTPLQALNLLNDITYVEAARVLAARVMRSAKGTNERLTLLFRLALARRPTTEELRILDAGLARHRAHYADNRKAAQRLVEAGEASRDLSLDPAEHAAYTAMASVVLNTDEAITRE